MEIGWSVFLQSLKVHSLVKFHIKTHICRINTMSVLGQNAPKHGLLFRLKVFLNIDVLHFTYTASEAREFFLKYKPLWIAYLILHLCNNAQKRAGLWKHSIIHSVVITIFDILSEEREKVSKYFGVNLL